MAILDKAGFGDNFERFLLILAVVLLGCGLLYVMATMALDGQGVPAVLAVILTNVLNILGKHLASHTDAPKETDD